MTYKECKKYLNDANKILIQGSFSDAMNLKMKLIEDFKKEENNEWVNILEKISFLPYYQTASNDPIEQERRAQAMRNGVQNIINILTSVATDKKEELESNTNSWAIWLSIIALLLTIIGLLKDILIPL